MNFIDNNWFASWFDSEYYHKLYKNRSFTEAEAFISNLIEFLSPEKSSKILDLGCGKGRHSVFINKLGYQVEGVDLSENSIEYAKQFNNDRLSFAVHDMRNKYKENEFDFVFNLFTSFGYFNSHEENISVIKSMRDNLLAEGIIVIDYLNAHKVISTLKNEETKHVDGTTFLINKEIVDNNVVKHIRFNDKDIEYHFQERVELLTPANFQDYFNATKLQLIHTFGDYQLNNFNEETSERLILIAKK